MRSLKTTAVLLGFLALSPAQAATLVFSYGTGPTAVGGTLTGTLQPDNNRFFITGGSNFTLGGVVIYATPPALFGSRDVLYGITPLGLSGVQLGMVTLDGTLMDLSVEEAPEWDGLRFSVGNAVAILDRRNSFISFGPPWDSRNETFDPALWSASLVGVPEPMSAALFGAGLLGLGLLRRRGTACAKAAA